MILEASNISKEFNFERGLFDSRAGRIRVLDRVNFILEEFTTLGIVGESGAGKTTLAKILVKLIPADSGQVIFNNGLIKDFRRDVQIIFQNPYNSLDPKMRIKDSLYEPLLIHSVCPRRDMREKSMQLLKIVGLDEDALDRYPGQFSGGQRQRICIARALACGPKLLILDEPLSSLDLTIQAKLLDLFEQLKEKFRLTYIFISHNLAVIRYIADKVMVMKDGRVVEYADRQTLFERPVNEYTRQLLEAAK